MSKGLEDLKWLVDNGYITLHSWQEDVVMLDCVDNIEKELKALEIIRSKEVNVAWLTYVDGLKGYNSGKFIGSYLTQEEYDLLKEQLI